MRSAILLFTLTLSACTLIAQEDELIQLVKQGIELHDSGQYAEAMAAYEEAMKIDPKSALVFYEMGYTCHAMGNYKQAVKYADKVLKQKGQFLPEAFVLKGNALDEGGKPKKAIGVYEEAIRLFPEEYLMHFNLGITQYKINDLEAAETALQNAILLNLGHASSHYYLGLLQFDKGNRVQGILSHYLFLLLEPDTDRADQAFQRLWAALTKGPTQTGETDFTISLGPGSLESGFGAIDILLSSIALERAMKEELADVSDEAWFAGITGRLFEMLEKTGEDQEGFWWETYVPLYAAIHANEYTEPFAYYISMTQGEAVIEWLDANEEKVNAFFTWIQEY